MCGGGPTCGPQVVSTWENAPPVSRPWTFTVTRSPSTKCWGPSPGGTTMAFTAELARGRLLLLAEEALQIGQSLDGDVVALRLDLAPNGGGAGDDFHVGGEALDDDVAGVTDGLEGGHDGLP